MRLPWFVWRIIPHSHGSENMEYLGMYWPGDYQIYQCVRCHWKEAI